MRWDGFAGRLRLGLSGTLFAVVGFMATPGLSLDLVETPGLEAKVADGTLPSVEQRVPDMPRVMTDTQLGGSYGQHGGGIDVLMRREKDLRIMIVYMYARLVGYNRDYELVPDILADFNVEDGRAFTFHIRPGHKWSDGHPFTAEDFRYYWEDVANDPSLKPFGPPPEYVVDGELPSFEVIDDLTVRFSWSKPNPDFLPAIAGARPLDIVMPAHYLRQYHERYADPEALAAKIEESRLSNWAELHAVRDEVYNNTNPDLPVLWPWQNRTPPPSQRFVFERNPFYHAVDAEGHQLPYIDQIVMNVADSKLIPLKAGAGETDLQARYLPFGQIPFLKQGETRNDYTVHLWREASASHLALYPNLTVTDPEWRALMRDPRFRRALSMAINRDELNQVIYFGLAHPAANTVLPQSPLFDASFQKRYAEMDLAKANALLDELGLDKRGSDGIRLLPDGRPMEIVVETGESGEPVDILQLIVDSWEDAGIELLIKPYGEDVLRNRLYAGDTLMTIRKGWENGIATPVMSPRALAPVQQYTATWPAWGQYHETGGGAGEAPDIGSAQELLALYLEWQVTPSAERKEEIWQRMLEIHADQVFVIGLIQAVPQPVVVANALRNVPTDGVYNWEPGAHFGIYKPETFWLDQ